MKKCDKDCKHFQCLANTDECGSGICSYPMSYFPVEMNTDCVFIPKPYTCKDCTNFGEYECLGVEENDKPCMFFLDKKEDEVYNILYTWKMRGIDVTEKIKDIMDNVEKDFEKF